MIPLTCTTEGVGFIALLKGKMGMQKEPVVVGIGIYCSDPRAHLWREMKKKLIPPEETYAAIGVLGGAICLARPIDLIKEFHFMMAQINFVLGTFPETTKIMVVGHDCGYYNQILRKSFTVADKEADIAKAAAFLVSRKIPGIKQISAYFAHGKEVNFKDISPIESME